MRHPYKIILILVANLLVCFLLFLAIDYSIYKYYKSIELRSNADKFEYNADRKFTDLKIYFNKDKNNPLGRYPSMLEFTDKIPIVIFGCSFAYGLFLDNEQTFTHKLANQLKRPVYNRAIPGQSVPFMYYQSTQDSFYEDIPNADSVIYIMMFDHYRRMLAYSYDIIDTSYFRHYSIKKNKFIEDNYNNRIANFIKSLYISKLIHHKYIINFINNPKNQEKLIDITVKYFIETRNNFEKHWNKRINFTVILYNYSCGNILYTVSLKKELEKNGFNIIDTNDVTNEDLFSEKYIMRDNGHPTEAAWDLLTPKIVEILKRNNK